MKNVGYSPNWIDRLYLFSILRGLGFTLGSLLSRKVTEKYPEERKRFPPRSRGIHRLAQDEKGRVKCVGCHLCATACPANCIRIEAAEAPWEDRDKYPERFEIDVLRCIFCGYCVEACPEEAIVMGGRRVLVAQKRGDLVFDKERLLSA